MRKSPPTNRCRKPSVDPLEGRCLLSGVHEVVGQSTVPAIVRPDADHSRVDHDSTAVAPMARPGDDPRDHDDPAVPDLHRRDNGSAIRQDNVIIVVVSAGSGPGSSDAPDLRSPTPGPGAPWTSHASDVVPAERPPGTMPFGNPGIRPDLLDHGSLARVRRAEPIAIEAEPESEDGAAVLLGLPPGDCLEVPPPSAFRLIDRVCPFDRASLEGAFARFFSPFDDLGVGQPGRHDLTSTVPPTLVLAVTFTALELSRRRLQGKARRVRTVLEGGIVVHGFPDLPGSWSKRPR